MKILFIFLILFFMTGMITNAQVGINSDNSTPDPSAMLEVKSASKGFLPPRMTTDERNTIELPAEGLVIYNTDEKVLNVYNGTGWNSMTPVPAFACGLTITINHLVSGGVAPLNKTVAYGTVTGIPGEPTKCWITSNLGADHQATAVNDATEASAGWYWQFNQKQGYKHDGTTRTPNTTWITYIGEDSDWISANDPCSIELGTAWHIPTNTEWDNVDNAGNWVSWNGPWGSGLKMHAAGYLLYGGIGALYSRGEVGEYWSSSQYNINVCHTLEFTNVWSAMGAYFRAYGLSVRCIRNN
ncbi:MAG: hypothetical protein WCK09_18855 [Bacteroidota bacterium]